MKYMIPALVALAVAGCATQETQPAVAGTTWTGSDGKNGTYIFKFGEGGVLEMKIISTLTVPETSATWEALAPNFGTFSATAKGKTSSGTWTLDGDKLTMVANGKPLVFTQVK